MRKALLLAFLLLAPLSLAQVPQPDLGVVGQAINDAAGVVIPPALNATYSALGQNITREDVRLFLDVEFTKGAVGAGGFLIGSGTVEVEADIKIRGELRVVSSDRIRAAIEGENPYNVSAENATWLSQAFIPAEMFRVSASAEVIASFQEEMEKSLEAWLVETVPELRIIALDIGWENTFPLQAFTDVSLTDPPIVVTLDATLQYLRVESFRSLLSVYLESADDEDRDAKRQYVKDLKEENADPLRARDFFAAAAYTQLLNLSMQPGWSLDVGLHVPRGYSFEYVNEEVWAPDEQTIGFQVDALDEDAPQQSVVLASITHRRGVALGLLVGALLVVAVVGFPAWFLYGRYRVPHLRDRHDGS